MAALSNLSRKAMIGLTLLVCYLPFAWIPFLVERQLLGTWLKLWPLLPGTMVSMFCWAWLSHFGIETANWVRIALNILFSIAIPAGMLLLLFRAPRWRLLVLVLSLLLMGYLSLAAYSAYKA